VIQEAQLEEGEFGAAPTTSGWFVVNVRDALWRSHPFFGSSCRFESLEAPFTSGGVNIRVLQPGQPNCYYHAESVDEHFLALAGECLLLVEGEERRLGAWDFVHCPPGTEHVFVGAGDGPCVILMVGARVEDSSIVYPRSDLALRHRAGVETETHSPAVAYAAFERPEPGRPAGWDSLPWA
jgi:uncharacterized cupin superfamily protein